MSDKLVFGKCGCSEPVLTRLQRSWWMKLLPGRRLYYCHICNCRVLTRQLPEGSRTISRPQMPVQSD